MESIGHMHPVDQVLSPAKLLALGTQHVLVMYAGGVGNPEYGNPVFLGTSFAVLVFILVITRFVRGFIANISVLLGIVFGFVIALLLGRVSFQGLGDAAWLDIVVPFHFGWPTFDPLS